MRTSGLELGLAAVLAFDGCRPPSTSMSEDEREALRGTILHRLDEYVDALATLDAQRMAPFYAEGFHYYPDEHAMGRDSLLSLIEGLGREFRRYDVSNDVVEITPLAHDVVLAAVRFHTLQTDTAGVESRVRGTVTWVWARDGTEWRMIHGQSIHLPDTTQHE